MQADAMADDLEIDFDKMSLWTKGEQLSGVVIRHFSLSHTPRLAPLARTEEAIEYFESGGEVTPSEAVAPPMAAPLPKVPAEEFKKWFPKAIVDGAPPKFRIVCFHNAGSAESVYTGKGARALSCSNADWQAVSGCLAAWPAFVWSVLLRIPATRHALPGSLLRACVRAIAPRHAHAGGQSLCGAL